MQRSIQYAKDSSGKAGLWTIGADQELTLTVGKAPGVATKVRFVVEGNRSGHLELLYDSLEGPQVLPLIGAEDGPMQIIEMDLLPTVDTELTLRSSASSGFIHLRSFATVWEQAESR